MLQGAVAADKKEVSSGDGDLRHQLSFLQQFAEPDIAHSEPERGEIDAAEVVQQLVVAPTAADRAQFAPGVEEFENDAGVILEAADNGENDVHPVANAERFQVSEVCRHTLEMRLDPGGSRNRAPE